MIVEIWAQPRDPAHSAQLFLSRKARKEMGAWPPKAQDYTQIRTMSVKASGKVVVTDILDMVFSRHNQNGQKAYSSISVGDILVLTGYMQPMAYFCDSIGWVPIPGFFEETRA